MFTVKLKLHTTNKMHLLTSIQNISVILIITLVLSNAMEIFANNFEDVIYTELKEMGADCDPFDSCKKSRERDELLKNNCNCDSTCSEFDTCCLDSEYRVTSIPRALNSDIKCLPVYRSRYGAFMIDKCQSQNGDSSIESLCESNGEDTDDPFLMIPATSLATKITYKNYYCLVCNEDIDEDQVVLWKLELQSTSEALDSSDVVPQLRFNNLTRSWMVVGNETSKPTTITLRVDERITKFVKLCKAGEKGLISNCSKEWTDDSIVQKCAAYMATVGFQGIDGWKWYRNPHCALCNNEDVKRRECGMPLLDRRHWAYDEVVFVRTFVLNHETSCGRHMIFDMLAKKCRCNTRDYVKRDGKCLSKTT